MVSPFANNAETKIISPILDVQGLRKSFGGAKALSGVSFTLELGEIYALVGENVAGKSTLIKILSGSFGADSGAMTLSGTVYLPASPHHS